LNKEITIAVVGLGYVGLPLALEFGVFFRTIAFDISKRKINSFKKSKDPSNFIKQEKFYQSKKIVFSNKPKSLKEADYIIVCLPTPVNRAKKPDLTILKNGCKLIAKNLKKKTIIIFESTVYPGVTEDICAPVIEKYSNLKWKKDFNIGYSPERINPGDKKNILKNITKIISGDNKKTVFLIKKIYNKIINKLHIVNSIKVAESAKVIENIQRDINIALMNELSIVFSKLKINFSEILKAAKTKWNFLDFKPGLVGGHCIGVDPYYLKFLADKIGHKTNIINAGRKLNDGMVNYLYKKILNNNNKKKSRTILVLGITYKKDCPDSRNSKIAELVLKLKKYKFSVDINDPLVDEKELFFNYKLSVKCWEDLRKSYDIIIFAVDHKEYLNYKLHNILQKLKPRALLIDINAIYDKKKLNKDLNIFNL
jgi:UDP-N-acetyl-D-galactosamine dehydrogenase